MLWSNTPTENLNEVLINMHPLLVPNMHVHRQLQSLQPYGAIRITLNSCPKIHTTINLSSLPADNPCVCMKPKKNASAFPGSFPTFSTHLPPMRFDEDEFKAGLHTVGTRSRGTPAGTVRYVRDWQNKAWKVVCHHNNKHPCKMLSNEDVKNMCVCVRRLHYSSFSGFISRPCCRRQGKRALDVECGEGRKSWI